MSNCAAKHGIKWNKSLLPFFIRASFCPASPNNSGNLANAPTFDELWIHFQAILTRIFGKQDGTAAAPAGVSSSTYGTPVESSWMFAA